MKTIGPYQITGTLGQGGMGIVYSAWDDRLNRQVALKTIRSNDSDPTSTERLRREARAGARVNHPNICQLYDVGSEQGQFYIAMELLEGESLASRLEDGALPLKEAVSITVSALSALEALHTHGLIHRDLKPSNIFLTPHGVKLLDFGLARPLLLDEDESRLTLPGTIIGSPRYLSPEQLMGEAADHRADLFAVGAVLYEMLTGRPAFDGQTIAKVVHAVVDEHPPALDGPPSVVAVDRIIHKALAKRPAGSLRHGARDGRRTADDDAAGRLRRHHRRRAAIGHAAHRPAVSDAASRSGNRFPVVQPCGRAVDVAVGTRVAGGALEPDGISVCHRSDRSRGAGEGGRGRRADRHHPAWRRRAARDRAAR